jgi:CheY-like chemotaxis protein
MIARKSMAKRLSDSTEWEHRNQHPSASRSLEIQCCVEPGKYYAYNQTRGHLLGSDVDVADFSAASFKDRIPALATDSGAGVWLVPFRGISIMRAHTLIDLIYLDSNSVVIDVVESFPIFRISKESPAAASVLALPRHMIQSTQTRRGDQLQLCIAAELDRRPLQEPDSSGQAETEDGTDSGKFQPICSGSGSRLPSDDSSGQERLNEDAPLAHPSMSRQARVDVHSDWNGKQIKPTKNWLQRWWSPEPRKAQRESFTGLAANFWTGACPVEHCVRDISLTGLYVVTDERWFPGTQIRMMLTNSGESTDKISVTANTSVVRWGDDGLGLKFVMEDEVGLGLGQNPLGSGINKKELNRFLQLARSGKRESETRDTASQLDVAQDDATVSRIPALLTVSPLGRKEAISGEPEPIFDDLFIGPINSSLLINSLKDLPRPVSVPGASPSITLSNTSPLQLPRVVSSTPSRRRPSILLIDDEYLDIMFLASTLEEDYEVIFASDGVTALESAACNMPDLILLDVMMPGIDGFEVCRRLKADNRTREIPVIFITGLSEAAAEAKRLRMGAVDYISKPFHPAPLKARVNMHIRLTMTLES